MIYLAYIARDRAADLTVDASFGAAVHAWRMFEVAHEPGTLACWLASTRNAADLRASFALPRLYASSVVAMVESVFEQPGLYGPCVFSAGRLVRARVARPAPRDLLPAFNAVAEPAAPALPAVPAVVDLTIVPDTPCNSSA